MKQYLDLVRHVLGSGTRKENRTGVDTLSTFGYYYEHDLSQEGFPLLTTKKMPWKSIVVELLWFLSGSNKSEFLERHGVTFWRPWYNEDGTVNACYGPAWRGFEYPNVTMCTGTSNTFEFDGRVVGELRQTAEYCDVGHNDQIAWAIEKLENRPMSRDIVVSAWQPHVAQRPPTSSTYWAPCHCMFICNVQITAVPASYATLV